jgi:hypothetical protein
MIFQERMQVSADFPYWFHEEAFGRGMVAIDKNTLVLFSQLEELLQARNIDPASMLVRGGFKSGQDIELILKTGWDYEGRSGPKKIENSTYTTPFCEIDVIHRFEDPAYSPFFWLARSIADEHHPAIVFYHADKLCLSAKSAAYRELRVYEFLQPDDKLSSLAGIVEFDVVPSENPRCSCRCSRT